MGTRSIRGRYYAFYLARGNSNRRVRCVYENWVITFSRSSALAFRVMCLCSSSTKQSEHYFMNKRKEKMINTEANLCPLLVIKIEVNLCPLLVIPKRIRVEFFHVYMASILGSFRSDHPSNSTSASQHEKKEVFF